MLAESGARDEVSSGGADSDGGTRLARVAAAKPDGEALAPDPGNRDGGLGTTLCDAALCDAALCEAAPCGTRIGGGGGTERGAAGLGTALGRSAEDSSIQSSRSSSSASSGSAFESVTEALARAAAWSRITRASLFFCWRCWRFFDADPPVGRGGVTDARVSVLGSAGLAVLTLGFEAGAASSGLTAGTSADWDEGVDSRSDLGSVMTEPQP